MLASHKNDLNKIAGVLTICVTPFTACPHAALLSFLDFKGDEAPSQKLNPSEPARNRVQDEPSDFQHNA